MAEPLIRLTRKDISWQWGKAEKDAFRHLKHLLTNEDIMSHFDPTLDVGLACDASEVGLGVVLFHRWSDGTERPIHNASKTLTQTQRKYSQVQKEALAVVFGLKKFHQYLFGRKFILVTDHKPLLALFSPNQGTPVMAANPLARWALQPAHCDYTIEYRVTEKHGAGCQHQQTVHLIMGKWAKTRRVGTCERWW